MKETAFMCVLGPSVFELLHEGRSLNLKPLSLSFSVTTTEDAPNGQAV